MITFELDNQEYSLPEHLTIENYVKIYKVKDVLGEEFFQAKLINAVTGVKMESILQTNHTQVNYISNYLISLFPDSDYKFVDSFELNGIKYGFIPSWKYMSFAEFVDLDTLMTKKPEEIIENLHIICAIMYRPITNQRKEHDFDIENYDSISMERRAELFRKELDVKYVLGGQFFFSQFVDKFSNYSPQSLKQKMRDQWMLMKITWKYRKLLWKSLLNRRLDGLPSSTDYATMTLQNTIKSFRPPFWKRSINFFTFWKKKKK